MANLKEIVENLDKYTLIDFWNYYCDENYYNEDRIESMDLLDDFLDGLTPTEIIDRCGDVDTRADYFKDGIYGIETFYLCDLLDHIYIDDLVDFIEREPDYFIGENYDIEEYFEESEENT